MTRVYKQYVDNCEECPNSFFVKNIDGGGLACDATGGNLITDEESTPGWCPLEEVKQ